MKKYIGLAIVAGLVLSFSSVSAENDGSIKNTDKSSSKVDLKAKEESSKNKMEVKADAKADAKLDIKREAFKEKVKADQENFKASFKSEGEKFSAEVKLRKEEFKKFNVEKRMEFWGKAKNMFSQRFEVAISNLEKAQARISTLIDTLNADNKETVAAAEYLNSSKQKLSEAKVKLAEVKALLPATGEKVTPEIFEKIKLGAREAKNLLKESHHALVSAIREIKGLKSDSSKEE